MKNKLYLALVIIIVFAFLGCSSTSEPKVAAETKTSLAPAIEATPEVTVIPVVAETPIKETPAVESVKAAFVISDNANLRKIGTSEGEIIDTIPEGASLEVLKQKGGWFFVRVDEKTGWLHGDTIQFGTAPDETEEKTDSYTPTENYRQSVTVSEPPPLVIYSVPVTPRPTLEPVKTPVPVDYSERQIQRETEAYRNLEDSPARVDAPSYPTTPSAPSYPSYSSSPNYSPSYDSSPGEVSVKGYTRKDGTYVAPYKRTKGNSTTSDNWSTKGNVNPYTGKRGSRKP